MVARDFASMEGLKSGGILYVFPAFQTAPAEQKIRHPPAGDLFRGSLGFWRMISAATFGAYVLF